MSELSVGELQKLVDEYVVERDWRRFHKPKDVAISIAIESSELLELFQWKPDPLDADAVTGDVRARIAEELADITIYCACMANALGMSLSDALLEKIQKNREKYPARDVSRAKDWDEVRSILGKSSDAEGDG